jgi:phage shock protein PspC (stress-responsive transcriptional regulator)
MNKVISIHLRGVAFQLEESGYDALRAYLDKAERQLSSNPDRAEIIADIEQAIADKFRGLLSPSRNVILTSEVEVVIREMGPVTDGAEVPSDDKASDAGKQAGAASSSSEKKDAAPPRRLYRIKEGAIFTGVCNGLAAYIGVDVTLLRLVVAILVFFSFGTVAVAYLVATIIIPVAETATEKAAAAGPAPTAQEFIRRAKQGYYEGIRSISDRAAHRAWKRKFKTEMRDWKRRFKEEVRWGSCASVPPPPVPPVTPPPPPPPGYQVAMPVLGTLKGVLFLFAAIAVISLVATGALFGVALPGHLPVWAGVVIIIIAYKVLASPLKAMRRQYYYRLNGWYDDWHPLTEVLMTLFGILFFIFAVFVADRMIPGFHQVLLDFRDFLQRAFDSLHQWWIQKGSS